MSSTVHDLDVREGGTFRVSLSYEDPDAGTGKSDARTDTYRGRFLEVVPGERVVEEIEFETEDPAFAGTMVLTTITAVDGGTLVEMQHEGVPSGVRPEDNELGARMALGNLAALVEPG